MIFKPEEFRRISKIPEMREKAPEDYWFKIVEKLSQERGKIPDPAEIEASALIEALGIPSGPYSAIELPRTKESIERDEIIAKYLTNKPGVFIEAEDETGEKFKILSSDFRDLYPNGLPNKLKEVLDERTLNYINAEFEHQKKIREKYGETKNEFVETECPIHYFRLPSGIDLFLRGYSHDPEWQRFHGPFLREANKFAQIICIEGFYKAPFGESLDLWWSRPDFQLGHYDVLMHEAVKSGFNGLFTETDARELVFVNFDGTVTKLPDEFFQRYFEYLEKKFPNLTEKVKSSKELKNILIKQSTTFVFGIMARRKTIFHEGKMYDFFPYLTEERETSFEPTFLELGQHLFSDALASIKLLLIAKLMADGHLKKGPIIDYEGAGHLSSKTFFLKYPQYAMEVVLRTIPYLFEGRIKKVPEIYEVFKNPDKKEIVKQIAKLVFKKPEEASEKPVEIGPNQRKLLDEPIDFLKIYNIDPQKVIPSEETIKEIRERLKEKP